MSNPPPYRLGRDFFSADVLEVAPALVGMTLVLKTASGPEHRLVITETEAYRGEEDKACHASRGRTKRTEVMYGEGGLIYVYLIYGMYWMLNVVTGPPGEPQAVLIRGAGDYDGPGKLTAASGIDGTFYGADTVSSVRIWFEGPQKDVGIVSTPRIGIDYAGSPWREKLWRYTLQSFYER